MCATGGKCYTETDRCDGRFDCDDQSDERDCPSKKKCSILLYCFVTSSQPSLVVSSCLKDHYFLTLYKLAS